MCASEKVFLQEDVPRSFYVFWLSPRAQSFRQIMFICFLGYLSAIFLPSLHNRSPRERLSANIAKVRFQMMLVGVNISALSSRMLRPTVSAIASVWSTT
jgi:hypothetical protein